MIPVDQTQKYGVKLSVISELDSVDMENIISAIRSIGYKITFIDNGNVVCEKIGGRLDMKPLNGCKQKNCEVEIK